MQALLTLRAEGNGGRPAGRGGARRRSSADPPIRERFAAAATIGRSLEALPASPENEQLREASEAVIALGGGADNLFEARSQELRALAEMHGLAPGQAGGAAAAVTVAHDALLKTLAPIVDDAGFDLVITSEEVTAQSKEAITGLVEGGVNALQAC